jgi:hypothetical protein
MQYFKLPCTGLPSQNPSPTFLNISAPGMVLSRSARQILAKALESTVRGCQTKRHFAALKSRVSLVPGFLPDQISAPRVLCAWGVRTPPEMPKVGRTQETTSYQQTFSYQLSKELRASHTNWPKQANLDSKPRDRDWS